MDDIYEQWRKDLIKAGLLQPDEEIDNIELSTRWQEYQVRIMKESMSGSFADLLGDKESKSDRKRSSIPEMFADMESPFDFAVVEEQITRDVNIRDGIKHALNALITKSEGASYCMIVVNRAWINFRYKRKNDNLHMQVAGNKYISPLSLSEDKIKHLEQMGIPPEPMSVEIYARDYDESRNLDEIVDTIFEIFTDVYCVNDNDDAYVELDLGKGEDEAIRDEIENFFNSRSGKQFRWLWISNHN